MIWQHEVHGMILDEIAYNLCVHTSTVHRIVKQFNRTGQVCKKRYSNVNRPVKLTKSVQLTILHLVLDKPGIYLREIQQELQWMFALHFSEK